MRFWKKAALFVIGGGSYTGLELLWRGRSHWTMFCLGGLCFLLIGKLDRVEPRLPLPAQIAAGAAICTAGELLFGLLFNREYTIWDYRQLPFNWGGQICLCYSLLWMPLSLLALRVYGMADHALSAGKGRLKPET